MRRLPEMRDLADADLAAVESAASVCREYFSRRGYVRIETPLLEETELFLRKSGGELASRLYSFNEPGGYPVSLRPEYTAPALRWAIETGALAALPLRVQYCGPVFRHTPPSPGVAPVAGQFTQLGAEIIGAGEPRADGEIISMAWSGLNSLGLKSPRVVVGHVGLLWELLKPYGLSERARLFLVNSVGLLREGKAGVGKVRDAAASLGLAPGLVETRKVARTAARKVARIAETRKAARTDALDDEKSLALVESVLGETLGEPVARYSGTRTAEEIVARLARKLTAADDPEKFGAALGLLADMAVISGPVGKTLTQGRKVTKRASQDGAAFDRVEAVVSAAVDEGVPEDAITADLGLARGIAYYTGMVFDLTAGDGAAKRPVGGGGRYDGLPRALGADRDAPALGFAYNMDAVAAAMPARASGTAHALLVVPSDASAAKAAATHAARLRERGETAIVEVDQRGRAERERFARSAGVRTIITVSANGRISEEAVR